MKGLGDGAGMRWFACALLLTVPASPWALGGENPLQAARTGVEQWVQTRQLISRTRSDWESEKEILLQTKALFERELAGVEAQIAKVSTNSTQVDRERAEAERDLKESAEALENARQVVAGVEGRIRVLSAKLPAPLLEAMQPLMAKVPEDGKASKVSPTERVQTVVSLLNEVDKFNNSFSLYSEKRKNEKGEEVSVETAYVGLGAAFFVNQTGEFAGSGSPGEKGWEWSPDASLAGPVREVVRIYRGERTATFVPLPVTVR